MVKDPESLIYASDIVADEIKHLDDQSGELDDFRIIVGDGLSPDFDAQVQLAEARREFEGKRSIKQETLTRLARRIMTDYNATQEAEIDGQTVLF